MGFRRAAVSFCMRGVLNLLCRIDCREFKQTLSKNKPLIVAFNHVNFLEVPILVAHNYPLKVTGLVKSETWKNPFFAFLFNTYRAIPIDRRGAFSGAFKEMKKALDDGFFVCIAPEGTRSKDGVLGRGKAGIIQFALEADVPILPVVHCGGEHIWENIRHCKRTPLYFKAGKPFRINFEGKPGKEEREAILDEVMGQMARLLPADKRGIYAQQAERECIYLDYSEHDTHF